MSTQQILDDLGHSSDEKLFFTNKFYKLNQALVGIIDNFSLVNYCQVDITDEDSLTDVLMQIDNMLQYDDYRMPNDKNFQDEKDPDAMED